MRRNLVRSRTGVLLAEEYELPERSVEGYCPRVCLKEIL